MAEKASKFICVDEEVHECIHKLSKENHQKPNEYLRFLLNLLPKKAKIGRPPKPLD